MNVELYQHVLNSYMSISGQKRVVIHYFDLFIKQILLSVTINITHACLKSHYQATHIKHIHRKILEM
jgi:hypothetical protein